MAARRTPTSPTAPSSSDGTTPTRPGESQGTPSSATAELTALRTQVAELQRERDHLVALVDILTEISASLHFVDILQTIARKLGETFGLDRCSIFLTGDQEDVRLVASYEDPSIRNLVVDLNRYPELKRAFESGDTVFIPDAAKDPALRGVWSALGQRNVRSIIVIPIRWRGAVIGAIFLRTEREAVAFSDADVRFCKVVAELTARALHNAHRFEALFRGYEERTRRQRAADLERIALVAFLRRLLDRYAESESHVWAETLLARASDEELGRLVGVALGVIREEAKG